MLFNRITPVKTTQINAYVYAIKTGTVNLVFTAHKGYSDDFYSIMKDYID